jgi:hypothetical protein
MVSAMTNRITDAAAAMPKFARSVPWLTRNVTMVVVALAGPPLVRIHTMSNSWSDPIIDRNAQVRIVGPSSGIVMLRCTCHQVAPSSCAASYKSSGML